MIIYGKSQFQFTNIDMLCYVVKNIVIFDYLPSQSI